MNNLSREKQIEVIAALCEGVGIRTASRLTGVSCGTVGMSTAVSMSVSVSMSASNYLNFQCLGLERERFRLCTL